MENSLYGQDNTIFLEGDAKKSIQELLQSLTAGGTTTFANTPTVPAVTDGVTFQKSLSKAIDVLQNATNVVVIPGYGMALSKAQATLVEMVALLAHRGIKVKYAIHPVAGRMPGHMNVLLAEAEVDYEDLLDMDEANPLFSTTDAALVVGACDVVNPAAIEQEGTPISGMPILMAHNSRHVIVCNFDRAPGYSGSMRTKKRSCSWEMPKKPQPGCSMNYTTSRTDSAC